MPANYGSGERIRAVVNVANSSPERVSVGYANSQDRLIVEVYPMGEGVLLDRTGKGEFVSRFMVDSNEGQKLETFLGTLIRLSKPRISVLKTGEVIVLHPFNRDQFFRTEFWSLPDALELNKRELVMDPETAGSERVKELYKESGGVKPVNRPWWKFW